MKLTRQQKIARKAVATRKAREEFSEKYGETALIVKSLVQDNQVSGAKLTRLAAIKANITRNTYSPYVCSDGSGTCNF